MNWSNIVERLAWKRQLLSPHILTHFDIFNVARKLHQYFLRIARLIA